MKPALAITLLVLAMMSSGVAALIVFASKDDEMIGPSAGPSAGPSVAPSAGPSAGPAPVEEPSPDSEDTPTTEGYKIKYSDF